MTDFERVCRDNLLKIADAYARATGTARTTVSRKFYGQHGFFDDLAAGNCSITLSKFGSVVDAFRDRWPPNAEWPFTRAATISRPRKKIAVKNAAAA